jgi:thiamine-monophosphate kinase
MTSWQMGWFIVAINLSDIAAKGGQPYGIAIALGLPPDTSEHIVLDIMKGANACATQYGCCILGGDTKEAKEITLCGTAIGHIEKRELMLRKGAQPGDIVAVTGTLGKAGASYLALRCSDANQKAWKALFEPFPRINEGRLLAQQQVVTTSMDLSDGLSSSLYQLWEMNQVGFSINKQSIPLAPELLQLKKTQNIDEYAYGLHYGGDYELLLTFPKESLQILQDVISSTATPLTVIGEVTKNRDIVCIDGETIQPLPNKGYEHFRPRTL